MDDKLKDSFDKLDSNEILQALDIARGTLHDSFKRCTGRLMALNSVENRVYAFDTEDRQEFVCKFYRPNRWKAEQLREEHSFLEELNRNEVPVISPLPLENSLSDCKTLSQTPSGIYYCIFPKVRGRLKDELNQTELEVLARLLARLHITGEQGSFQHRLRMNVDTWIWDSVDELEERGFSDSPMGERYLQLIDESAEMIGLKLDELPSQRVHGDCHCGNVLWNENGPFFTDFDDCITAAPVQDLWMILRGRGLEEEKRRESFLSAYEQIHHFDRPTLGAIEALRALRMIHYNGWIARRWKDPSFPRLFPLFAEPQWWQEEIQALNECLDALYKL